MISWNNYKLSKHNKNLHRKSCKWIEKNICQTPTLRIRQIDLAKCIIAHIPGNTAAETKTHKNFKGNFFKFRIPLSWESSKLLLKQIIHVFSHAIILLDFSKLKTILENFSVKSSGSNKNQARSSDSSTNSSWQSEQIQCNIINSLLNPNLLYNSMSFSDVS